MVNPAALATELLDAYRDRRLIPAPTSREGGLDLASAYAVEAEIVRMWDRPFKVAWADIPDLLFPLIQDPAVVSIAQRWPVGPVDQFRELIWPAKNRPLLLRLFD